MKKIFLSLLIIGFGVPAFSQAPKDTTEMLGMAGDNLDLYAVLDLFQKSKTIEAFEKTLNDEKTKINNLDLDNNKKIDFIKVATTKKEDSYTFVLQVDVTKTETQDVASILVDKDKNKKISMQIVGAEALYGKDYVVEPKGNSGITPNPGYTGENPVTVTVPAPTTTTVVVQSAPIVEYIYSPAYIPYYPPYYYGFYPPYFAMHAVIAVGIYRGIHYAHHGGYYGGHYGGGGNTVVINNGNRNQINHNNSNTVASNRDKGTYGDNRAANRDRASASTRDGNGNRAGGDRASASTRDGNGNRAGGDRPSASTRDANGGRAGDAGGNRASASTRDAGGNRSSSSSSNWGSGASSNRSSSGSSRNMSSGSSYGGGGGSRGGGGYSGGGGSRGGGGGGGRRR